MALNEINRNHPLQSTSETALNDYMVTNDKNMSQFSYFLGGVDVTHQNLNQFNPYIRGYARLFVYRSPLFMEKAFPDLTNRFKSYLETGFRTVSGIGDLSVEFVDFEGGFGSQRFSNPGSTSDDTNEIQISLYELSGSPIREFIETWISGVRDPRTNVAHYHGVLAGPGEDITDGKVSYSEANHSAELIYYTMDPTCTRIEYACMLAHCFPTGSPRDHLNFESNSHTEAEYQITLRCTKYESRYINDIAAFYLMADTIKYSYLDFNPNISRADVESAMATSSFVSADQMNQKLGG